MSATTYVRPTNPRSDWPTPAAADLPGMSAPSAVQRHSRGRSQDLLNWRIPPATTIAESRHLDGSAINDGSVVYYVGCAEDDRIKIGKARVLKYRLSSLQKIYEGCFVIAAEPGAAWVERFRHHQFDHLREPFDRRSGGTEWFRPSEGLLIVIGQMIADQASA